MITDFFKSSPKKQKIDVKDSQKGGSSNDEEEKELEDDCARIKVTKKAKTSATPPDADDSSNSEPESFATVERSLHDSWKDVIGRELSKSYFKTLKKNLKTEEDSGALIFPPYELVFKAFEHCPWDQLKLVIIGQDPYHDNNQAEGLCFSVPVGLKIPSSLRNILKELQADSVPFEKPSPIHGHLSNWAKQGVLLLNTSLTVRAHQANSHKKFGWQKFTDAVIRVIAERKENIVFVLWGAQAQKKGSFINSKKHCIIKSVHPSGLSAHRGFFGSKPFSKANAYLKEHGLEEINWQI